MLPIERNLPTATLPEPLPIWMAALLASGAGDAIRWGWLAGRAVYMNPGTEIERIEPLGVEVPGGAAVVVTWHPGETGYTVELCALEGIAA